MTSKRSKKIKLACISDIHVGWRHFNAQKLIDNLDNAFPDTQRTRELDLVVWAGDVFDDLLKSNSESLMLFEAWFAKFLRYCNRFDISVYILEGTKSHDWGQSERLVLINERLGEIGADLTYIKNLSIRYDPKFDLHFLFVPDDLHHDTSITFSEVKNLLQEKQIEKVDFAFMHGNFSYQLPQHLKLPSHNEKDYLSIVKYLIFIGHVHTASQYERIYAQGSFDRKNHGEEEDKGHLIAELFTDGSFDIEFIVNKNAHVFKTIDVRMLSLESAINKIDDITQALPEDSAVRIYAEPKHPIFSVMRNFITKYPLINWSTKEEKVKETNKLSIDEITEINYKPLVITKENISSLITDRLDINSVNPQVLQRIPKMIESLR